jgi:hypothetical protein
MTVDRDIRMGRPAAAYRRAAYPRMHNMQVHIFRGPGRIFAVTTDPSGANLPSKYAPWAAFKTIELQKDEPVPGVDVNDCLRDLEAHGVHVTDAHVRITEEAIR